MAIAASMGDKAAFIVFSFLSGHGMEVQEAVTLNDLSSASFLLFQFFMMSLFLRSTGVSALRTRALPRWLAWSASAIAVVNLAALALPPSTGVVFIVFPFFLLWILAASVVLFIRQQPETVGAGVFSQARTEIDLGASAARIRTDQLSLAVIMHKARVRPNRRWSAG